MATDTTPPRETQSGMLEMTAWALVGRRPPPQRGGDFPC